MNAKMNTEARCAAHPGALTLSRNQWAMGTYGTEVSDDGAEEEEGGDVVYLVRKEPGAKPQRVPR